MNHAAKLARDEFITEALRATNDAIGDDEPTDQAFKIIAALKNLRDDKIKVTTGGVDYLQRVQEVAKKEWQREHGIGAMPVGDEYSATAGLQTPIGRLRVTTWRTVWKGDRLAWASEYYLNDSPITVREIKAAGLAQRPTTRNRQKKEVTK